MKPKRVLLFADGERDFKTFPPILEKVAGFPLEVIGRPWKSIRMGKGYQRKSLFGHVAAKIEGFDGAVAIVDRDKDHNCDRLRDLGFGREDFLRKIRRSRSSSGRPSLMAKRGYWTMLTQHSLS